MGSELWAGQDRGVSLGDQQDRTGLARCCQLSFQSKGSGLPFKELDGVARLVAIPLRDNYIPRKNPPICNPQLYIALIFAPIKQFSITFGFVMSLKSKSTDRTT